MSESLKLRLEPEDEIHLPDWIAATSLTLEEIGAVAVMACFETQAGGYDELLAARLKTPEMTSALKQLESKGVFHMGISRGNVHMHLDLDVVAPE